MVTRPLGRDTLIGEWGALQCAPGFTLTAPLDAAIHATIDHSRLRSQRLLDPRAEVRPHQVLVHVWITSRLLQLVPEFQEQPVLGPALRHLEEFSVKDGQLAGAKVPFIVQRVAFQVVGPLAKNLPGFDVVLHHCRHAVLLDRADLHADTTAQVACHDWAAALEDQFVLFHAAVPDFFRHQSAAGAAVYTDLTDLAEFVDAIVDRLVIGHIRVGEDDLQPRPGPEMGREQLAIGTELTQAGLHKHRNHRAIVQVGPETCTRYPSDRMKSVSSIVSGPWLK